MPYHKHTSFPQTPVQLMRSRFSAYALQLIDYTIETTDPNGPQYQQNLAVWKEETEHFAKTTSFQNLTILDTKMLSEMEGTVTFHARLQRITGEDSSFTEKSLFKNRKGKWFYYSGIVEKAEHD